MGLGATRPGAPHLDTTKPFQFLIDDPGEILHHLGAHGPAPTSAVITRQSGARLDGGCGPHNGPCHQRVTCPQRHPDRESDEPPLG